MVDPPRRRFGHAIEIAGCVVLLAVLSLNALRRMDYLGENAETIRMTDESRTAYIAKNIADGNGYSTNDLPAALVDFYDQKGKLHDEHWVNADRFPFAAYATAALYSVARSTSWILGILVYNLLAFVAFLTLLYRVGSKIFNDRYAGLGAVTIALLHPYTYQFLYWKDGDMLLLTTAAIALFYRYYEQPRESLGWRLAVGMGTLLAFVFLSRPNLGVAFLLGFFGTTLMRWWSARRTEGMAVALRRYATREGLVFAAFILWCLPFVIHSLSEWGKPLFSANNLYQLPLGTRFGMGTDTWWKYTEPGHAVTLSTLISDAPGQLLGKFTSSWVATLKTIVGAYGLELVLALGLLLRMASAQFARPLKAVAMMIGFAFITNLALLPLYGYQDYSYRHYLSFGLPIIWLASGRAVAELARWLRPAARRVLDHVRERLALYVLAIIAALVAWNFGASDPDANRLFGRTARLFETHWLALGLLAVAAMLRRWLVRPPWFPRIVVLAFTLVYSCYRPNPSMKRTNLVFFAANDKVWDTLRLRHGLVSSFALQGEVAWNTDRQNIPAPEWPMHVYSFLFDHKLSVEDLYIESADAMISTVDGPFSQAAPGFEGYARLQRYRTLPGYEVAFHDETTKGYPMFRIKPHPKASTVFHLVDPAVVQALSHTPQRIDLGDPNNVIYTAHGWEDYVTLDGKRAVAATAITRHRYAAAPGQPPIEGPWEDSSATFFFDEHHPRVVELELYTPAATSLQFYWNLDLYAYDRASDRVQHRLGAITTTVGWQRVRFEIPARLARTGLNKIGFRAGAFQPIVFCPHDASDDACTAEFRSSGPTTDADTKGMAPRVVRSDTKDIDFAVVSAFVGTLELHD